MAWIVIAIIFFGMVFWVLGWPLISFKRTNKMRPLTPGIEAIQSDINIQLARLEGVRDDKKNGRLSPQDFDGIEAEIGRQLLKSQRQLDDVDAKGASLGTSPAHYGNLKPVILPASIVFTCLIASLLLYGFLGTPSLEGRGLDDTQLAQRQQLALSTQTQNISNGAPSARDRLNEAEFLDLVQNAQDNPQNAQIQRALVRALIRRDAFAQAIPILEHILKIDGRSPDNLAALAEAQLNVSRGREFAEPLVLLNEALAQNPDHIQTRFYLAAIDTQRQNWLQAAQKWLELIALGTGNEPWMPLAARSLTEVEMQIFARVNVGPNADDIDNAASMSADDRAAFIASMVAGLEQRLSSQGGGVTEWLRLVRSYQLLGDQAQKDAAIGLAREKLKSPTALKAFNNLLTSSLSMGV